MNCTPKGAGIIAFEGLDATGKTRLSKNLAAATGWPIVRTPDPVYDGVVQRLRHDGSLASFLLFLSGCAYAWRAHETSGREFTIVDRFWLSTIVGYASSAALPIADIERLMNWTLEFLPLPACTVLLVSRRGARLDRLASRVASLPHEHCMKVETYWHAAAEVLQKHLRHKAVVVDTTSGDETVALAVILEAIQSLLAP